MKKNEINSEELFMSQYIDRNGKPIKLDSEVIWHNPDEEKRDLDETWGIYEFMGDGDVVLEGFGYEIAKAEELEVVA